MSRSIFVRSIASSVVLSFGVLATMPQRALAEEPAGPIDPYGPNLSADVAPGGVPLDPYGVQARRGTHAPPPLVQSYEVPAPMVMPPTAAPVPDGGYRAYDPYPYAPNPWAPGAGTCPEGCPQMQQPALTYRPTPPQMELRPRYGLMAGGISIFAGAWISTAMAGYLSDRGELAIPIAGPILTAIDLNRQSGFARDESMVTGLLVFDALVQTAGLAMAIAGGVSRKSVPKRNAYTQPYAYPSVSPYGAGVSGRF